MDRRQKALLIGVGTAAAVLLGSRLRKRGANLEGQVALITGGSRGLGLALVREFAAEGCNVALCARDPDELRAVQAEPGLGDVVTFRCDVTQREQVEEMVRRVRARFGPIDILVTNAGEIEVGPVSSMRVDDFRNAIDTMFWGVVYPTLAVLPEMQDRRAGRIVTITSIGGKVSVPHLLPYSCAKFAAVGFSEGLRAELSGSGVHVTTIAPGLMRTGSYVNAWFKGDAEREAAWFSLGATLPGISMNAERAARQVVTATKRGESEAILSLPAKLLAAFHGLFPGWTADVLGLANRLMLPVGSSSRRVRGRDTEVLHEPLMKAFTYLGRRAQAHFHQT